MTPPIASVSPPTVVLIGAGVVGLTCAVKLQAELAKHRDLRATRVAVVAREWPGPTAGGASNHSVDYASMWAGAHVRPIPARTEQLRREAAWLRRTVAEFGRLVDAGTRCGIARTTGVEFLDEPNEHYTRRGELGMEQETGLRAWRILSPSELPSGARMGLEYDTFCINISLYCDYLLQTFVLNGGATLRRELSSVSEAYTLLERTLLVVNATGVGFGDDECFPTRGQTVLTDMTLAKTVTRQHRDGSWTFLIPRFFGGGTVVGGTKEPWDWRSEPDLSTRNRLLAAGLALKPYAQPTASTDEAKGPDGVGIIADIVGRRPTRTGGVRLDVECVDVADRDTARGGRTGSVVHAYGAGGRGYEISWGLAEDVVKMAMELL